MLATLTGATPLLVLAVVLLAGIAAGSLARRLHLPSVTGQILAGVLLGPSALHLFDGVDVAGLQPVTHFALGLIAVMVGSHLGLRRLKNATGRLSLLLLFESTLTPLLVFAGLMMLPGASWPMAALLAALSVSTAPATIIALVKETRSRGIFVKTLIAAVALDNMACILLFELARASAHVVLDAEGGHSVGAALLAPLRQLVLAAAVGFGAGLVLIRVTKNMLRPDRLASASLAVVLLTVGLADWLAVSPLLAAIFLGASLANLTPDKDEVGHRVFDDFEAAIFAVFFTLAGMQLHLATLLTGGAIAGVMFSLRLVGKYLAARWSMQLAGAPKGVRKYLGLALVPQAGVAVGLMLLVKDDPVFEPIYELFLAIGLAVVTLNEIVGPILLRSALRRSGDAGKDRARLIDFLREDNIVTDLKADDKEQAITKLTDVLIRSNHLTVDREQLLGSILTREREQSTCIGEGIAVPHGTLEDGAVICGALGISSPGLPFDTPDGRPVHLMLVLATPESERGRHLEVLAALARAIGSDPLIQRQLFHAKSPAHVYELLHAEAAEGFNWYLDEE